MFGRLFGFRVTDVDLPALLSDPTGPLMLLETPNVRALAEVRGFEARAIGQQDVRAFANTVGRFVARHGELKARLLVVNPQAQLPPGQRARPSADVVRAAAREGIALLTTDSLLNLIERWRAGEIDLAGLEARLATPGELRP